MSRRLGGGQLLRLSNKRVLARTIKPILPYPAADDIEKAWINVKPITSTNKMLRSQHAAP